MTDTKKPLAERLLSKMQDAINMRYESLYEAKSVLRDKPSDDARNNLIVELTVALALYEAMSTMQAEAARG